jgi:hypothetical protein
MIFINMSRAEFVFNINKEKESERKRERDTKKKKKEREKVIFQVKFQNLTKRQFQKCKVKITLRLGAGV